MKKTTLLTAMLLILAFCASAFAAGIYSGSDVFNPTLANAIDSTAANWYATSSNRAALTVLLVGNVASDDVLGDENVLSSMLLGDSYVGRSSEGTTLVVAGTVSGNCLTIAYSPALGTGYYSFISNQSNAELAIAQLCGSDYYENSLSDILEVMTTIGNM